MVERFGKVVIGIVTNDAAFYDKLLVTVQVLAACRDRVTLFGV
jgi:hypothetical protein